ncbi:MAG TPA: YHS domain-containing protein [Bacteroidota bacterium]|nr:YHS domain-containing protein [Bacteroidota bacterium]
MVSKRISFLLAAGCALFLASGCGVRNGATDKAREQQRARASFANVHLDNSNDLVCGMSLAAEVGDTAHYAGKVFGFCSQGCKEKFAANPSQYLAASGE